MVIWYPHSNSHSNQFDTKCNRDLVMEGYQRSLSWQQRRECHRTWESTLQYCGRQFHRYGILYAYEDHIRSLDQYPIKITPNKLFLHMHLTDYLQSLITLPQPSTIKPHFFLYLKCVSCSQSKKKPYKPNINLFLSHLIWINLHPIHVTPAFQIG